MDEFRCEVRLAEAEGRPARLTGVLMVFGQQAADRRERFERGSLSWPDGGVVLNRQHQRGSPILRFTPVEREGKLVIDEPIPSTTAGADALAEIRSGLFRGLSIEFKSIKEAFVNGVRIITKGSLVAAGLVDTPAYSGAVVEARELAARRASDLHLREFLL